MVWRIAHRAAAASRSSRLEWSSSCLGQGVSVAARDSVCSSCVRQLSTATVASWQQIRPSSQAAALRTLLSGLSRPPALLSGPPPLWRGFAAGAESGLKTYKPTSPGQRHRVTTIRTGLWKGRPIKALTEGLRKTGGRNNKGHITARHRGGGAKRLYRQVDFKRTELAGTQGKVERIEYDPNRSGRIALVDYSQPAANVMQEGTSASAEASGAAPAAVKPVYRYILAPDGLKAGDTVASGPSAGIFAGNALAMKDMPVGTVIHNIEMNPGGGGKLVRAAGTSATLVKKDEASGYVTVRLASGETRLLRQECMATVGTVSNKDHHNRKLGKAGASRHLGRRPHVRGVAMNPVDHPHGGGEGKTSGGRPSVTPWGRPTKGYRTRNNKRTDKFIIERRYAKRTQ